MAITNIGNDDFEKSAPHVWIPDGWDFDRLIVPYQGSAATEDAFIASLEMWSPSDIDDNMFLSSFESDHDKQWPTIKLIYLGKKGGVLPPGRNESDDAIQAATSKRTRTGTILAEPATVEYYAPSTVLSYISRGGEGTREPPDPSRGVRGITITVGDTTVSIGTIMQEWIDALFTPQITQTYRSIEIVPGEYWQNVYRKTRSLSPFIFEVTSGTYILLYSPGNGYQVGDLLHISAGSEHAYITVTQVGGVLGGTGILAWTVGTNTFTTPHNALPASGGHGTGAGFNVIVLAP
jgi:hypothetical protein